MRGKLEYTEENQREVKVEENNQQQTPDTEFEMTTQATGGY